MQLKCLTLMTVLLSIHQVQATTRDDVAKGGINSIKNVTELSSNLLDLVGSLSDASSEPRLVNDLSNIIAEIGTKTAALGGNGSSTEDPFASSDQQDLCDSFSGFVNVTQELFGVFLDKEPLLSKVNSGAEDISDTLRALAFRVFQLGSKVIALAPSCADEPEKELEDFVGTANQTIASFQLGG